MEGARSLARSFLYDTAAASCRTPGRARPASTKKARPKQSVQAGHVLCACFYFLTLCCCHFVLDTQGVQLLSFLLFLVLLLAFLLAFLQLEDLAKVTIKGQVVQAAKIPTSNAYRRGDAPGSRTRCVCVICHVVFSASRSTAFGVYICVCGRAHRGGLFRQEEGQGNN